MLSAAPQPTAGTTTSAAVTEPTTDRELHILVHNIKVSIELMNAFLREDMKNESVSQTSRQKLKPELTQKLKQYSEMELKAIAKIYDSLDGAIFDLSTISGLAERIYANKALFNTLDDNCKAILAGECFDVALLMLKSGDIHKLPPHLLNRLVFSYVGDVRIAYEDKIYRQLEKLVTFGNPASEEQKEIICFQFAMTPAIMQKLSPAVKIQLLSFIKQRKDKFLAAQPTVSKELQDEIDNAFVIFTKHNAFHTPWADNPWPALAGYENTQCLDHCRVLQQLAFRVRHPNVNSPDEREAAAVILISDRMFSHILSARYSNRKRISIEHALESERFGLAMHYPSVAKLLIENEDLRGEKGEITDVHLEYIKKALAKSVVPKESSPVTSSTTANTVKVAVESGASKASKTPESFFSRVIKHRKVKRRSAEVRAVTTPNHTKP